MKREFSAGGILVKDGKVLMIKVRSLAGKEVWTFPKGHIEKGESKEEAALREVEEETGIKPCLIKELKSCTYFFRDKVGESVKKTVFWYLMKPIEEGKIKTPDEVIEVRWVDIKEAQKLATYRSDIEILGMLSSEVNVGFGE